MVWRKKQSGGGVQEEAEKVPRGHVPVVLAGGGDEEGDGERVLLPVRLLGDPSVAELLDMAAQQYGYGQPGVLRVPCDAGHFRRVVDGAMDRCGIRSV
ncbi:hypothetical protein ACP4OV_007698 [Aristida adscensionis]